MLDFRFDRISFWIGFISGGLFLWFATRVRPMLGDVRTSVQERVEDVRAGLSVSIEERYRQDIIRIVQNNHMASPLFALDEIAIPPRLIAPPPIISPDGPLPPDDAVSLTIPYAPD